LPIDWPKRLRDDRAVDAVYIVVGLLLATWPIVYRHQIAKIRSRLIGRGGQPERFDRAMNRRFIRVALVLVPIVGVFLIVWGATHSG
jgi:hypothetical protein